MALASRKKDAKLTQTAVTHCRFCHKHIISSEGGKCKTPCANLFSSLKDKEFCVVLGAEEVILSRVVNQFSDMKIHEDDTFSNYCYLPCGRSLVRAAGTLQKLFSKMNQPEYQHKSTTLGVSPLKRRTCGSPGSPSTKILPKRVKGQEQVLRNTKRQILGSSVALNFPDKENIEEQNKKSMLTVQELVRKVDSNIDKSDGITKIVIASQKGKITTYIPTGMEKTLVRAMAFKNPKGFSKAALRIPS